MANIDYLKLRECPSCGVSWVAKEWEDGTFHTRLCIESEDDYKDSVNCYRCPDCRASFPRPIEPLIHHRHTHNPFMNP